MALPSSSREEMPRAVGECLLVYFKAESTAGDDPPAATTILNQLEKPDVNMTLEFLNSVLQNFTELNREMQSTSTKIHLLFDKVSIVYKNLLSAFLKPAYLKGQNSLDKIRFREPANQIKIEKVYFGGKLMDKIANNNCQLSAAELYEFRLRCHRFHQVACTEIIKRLNFVDNDTDKIQKISIIDPAKVIKGENPYHLLNVFPFLFHPMTGIRLIESGVNY